MPVGVENTFDYFAEWLQSPLGRYLLAEEAAWFDRTTADIFGYKAVQLELPQMDCLRANRMPWRTLVGQSAGTRVRCCGEFLPFEAQSIDLLVMPHVLDYCADPHQVLREAERVLVPEGRLLITGFNPWSLWGLKRFKHKQHEVPWRGQFISLPRLKDWLSLLNLESMRGEYLLYSLPVQREKWLARSKFLEDAGDRWWPAAGGVYCLDVVKRVRGVRMIEPKWRRVPTPTTAPAAAIDKVSDARIERLREQAAKDRCKP